jgi:sulfatase modifying factor 1
VINSRRDGFAGTAPVGCYEPGLTGAYDMIGNVWEWTDSPFAPAVPRFTIKGGSYLCSEDYCQRYRVAARESLERRFQHRAYRLSHRARRGGRACRLTKRSGSSCSR